MLRYVSPLAGGIAAGTAPFPGRTAKPHQHDLHAADQVASKQVRESPRQLKATRDG
jgi:hypothetical protein